MLTAKTRFSEPELRNLSTIYTEYATPKLGLNLNQFSSLLGLLMNVQDHPFAKEMFVFYDRDLDGRVDFAELVYGLDIMERGTFDEKVRYCFEMYDVFAMQELDITTLRTLFKRMFSGPLMKMEEVLIKVKQ
jgi:Ca2+-binding EF-hand superfamily protein